MEAVEDHVGGNNRALAQAIAAEHPGVCVAAEHPGVCVAAEHPGVCVAAEHPGVCVAAEHPGVCIAIYKLHLHWPGCVEHGPTLVIAECVCVHWKELEVDLTVTSVTGPWFIPPPTFTHSVGIHSVYSMLQ